MSEDDDFVKRVMTDDPVTGDVIRAKVAELAAMDEADYLVCKKEEANALGISLTDLERMVKKERRNAGGSDTGSGRIVAFDDPEPWPEPVDGSELVEAMVRGIKKYASMGDHQAVACALWSLHAHAHDCSSISPVLGITSPQKECGKSTAMDCISCMTPRAKILINMPEATVFRIIEASHPTLLLDEGDTYVGDRVGLIGILNSGHKRRGATVPRCDATTFEVREYSTWAPKAIAAIKGLPDTLRSRSIEIRMWKALPADPIVPWREDRTPAEFCPLNAKAMRFIADHEVALRSADPSMPPGITARPADNWRPLLAIADAIGGEWPSKAREAAVYLCAQAHEVDPELGTQLLHDALTVMDANGIDGKIWGGELVAGLIALEGRPWGECNRGKAVTQNWIAKELKNYGIKPKPVRLGEAVKRGYDRPPVAEAVRHYCHIEQETEKSGAAPPFQGVTVLQVNETARLQGKQGVTKEKNVTLQNRPNPTESAECNTVTLPKGVAPPLTDETQDAFQERAAILEYDAGLTRQEAETQAADELEMPEFLRR